MAQRPENLAEKTGSRPRAVRADARAREISFGRTSAVCGLRFVRHVGKFSVFRPLSIAEIATAPARMASSHEDDPPCALKKINGTTGGDGRFRFDCDWQRAAAIAVAALAIAKLNCDFAFCL